MAVPPYVTAGTTIDADWGDQVANALINPFASTAARSSAITAPTAGQVTYISSNDTDEGLYGYNSGGQWRRAWNMPWGVPVATVSISSDTNAIGASATDINLATVTFTAVSNRQYAYLLHLPRLVQNTGAGEMTVLCTTSANAATGTGGRWFYYANGANYTASCTMIVLEGSLTGSTTRKFRAATTANTMDVDGGGYPGTLTVLDLGPTGAPA